MEKVTLTKEQAEAIEFALNTKRLAYFQSPEALLQSHIRSRHFLDEMYPLREIDSVTLAKALFVGYEVPQTPEEKLLDYYEACEIKAKAIVQHTLECLDITVKGIND